MSPPRLTTQGFINKAIEVHQDTYLYHAVEYVGARDKVSIECKVHGMFSQRPKHHLEGKGCPTCGKASIGLKHTISLLEFIGRATDIHSGAYSYENVDYSHSHVPVDITCKTHGSFMQVPGDHLRGYGCRHCAYEANGELKRLTSDEFFSDAARMHDNKYDYSESVFTDVRSKIQMRCGSHGLFTQFAAAHRAGQGCVKCAVDQRRGTTKEFISSAEVVHNGRYSYEKTDYNGSHGKVEITCHAHGAFFQAASAHLNGHGCVLCSAERASLTQDEFVSAASAVHGDRYSYEKTVYTISTEKVEIICQEHGTFLQRAGGHLNGAGCPICAKRGYKAGVRGSFYIMGCGDITKIGITNHDPVKRARNISNSYGREFTVLSQWSFDNGKIADAVETSMLASLKIQYKQPATKFDGSTECFLNVNYTDLLNQVNRHIQLLH